MANIKSKGLIGLLVTGTLAFTFTFNANAAGLTYGSDSATSSNPYGNNFYLGQVSDGTNKHFNPNTGGDDVQNSLFNKNGASSASYVVPYHLLAGMRYNHIGVSASDWGENQAKTAIEAYHETENYYGKKFIPVLFIDCEYIGGGLDLNDYANNRAIYTAFVQTIQSNGIKVGTYSSPGCWDEAMGNFSPQTPGYYWVAHYLGGTPDNLTPSNPSWNIFPFTSEQAEIWQYSGDPDQNVAKIDWSSLISGGPTTPSGNFAVYHHEEMLQSFQDKDAAIALANRYPDRRVVDTNTSSVIYTNFNSSTPFYIYIHETLLDAFDTLESAKTYANVAHGRRIINHSTGEIVYFTPSPDFPYSVYGNEQLMDHFKTKDEAIQYASKYPGRKAVDENNGDILYIKPTTAAPYSIYNHEKLISQFTELDQAKKYSNLYNDRRIVDERNQKVIYVHSNDPWGVFLTSSNDLLDCFPTKEEADKYTSLYPGRETRKMGNSGITLTNSTATSGGTNVGTTAPKPEQNSGQNDFKQAQFYYDKPDPYNAVYYLGKAIQEGYSGDDINALMSKAAKQLADLAYSEFHSGQKPKAISDYTLLANTQGVPSDIQKDAKINVQSIK